MSEGLVPRIGGVRLGSGFLFTFVGSGFRFGTFARPEDVWVVLWPEELLLECSIVKSDDLVVMLILVGANGDDRRLETATTTPTAGFKSVPGDSDEEEFLGCDNVEGDRGK